MWYVVCMRVCVLCVCDAVCECDIVCKHAVCSVCICGVLCRGIMWYVMCVCFGAGINC